MVVHPAVTLEGAQSRVTAVAPAATEKQKKGAQYMLSVVHYSSNK